MFVLHARTVVPTGQQPPEFPAADVVFVFDASTATADNFNVLTYYISELIGQLNAKDGKTQFGAVGFWQSAADQFYPLNQYEMIAHMQAAIRALVPRGGFNPTIFSGLSYANNYLRTGFNPNKLVVVISVGNDEVCVSANLFSLSVCRLGKIILPGSFIVVP